MINDKEFLWWIHERLVKVHGDNENADYMHRLREIIVDMPNNYRISEPALIHTNADALRKIFG
jgi:predicted protein tyrosine phosphatase